MEKKSPEEMLNELNRIYREREEQYRKWNQDNEEKSKKLEEKLTALAAGRKELNEKAEKLKADRDELDKREEELHTREIEFSQLFADLETARSEVMRLKKEAEDYKFERVLRDESSENQDLSLYILRSEHEEIVESLKGTIDTLRNERIHLLKNSLGLPENMEREKTERDEVKITVSALKQYIDDRNREWKAEVFNNDETEELTLKRNGIHYSFLFSVPPSFKISTEGLTQEQRDIIAQKYPAIQVTTKDDQVILMGYFTEDIAPEVLVDRVFDIGDCLT